MARETQFAIAIILAIAIIPLLHLLNIWIGDPTFMGLFTWGKFHIHLGLVGLVALSLGLALVLFLKRKSSMLLAVCIFLLLVGIIAIIWDAKDLVNGNILTGIQS